MENYYKDLEEYEDSFDCNNCGEFGIDGFLYSRTVSNGEVWICSDCKEESVFPNKPNEDDY